MPDYISDIFNDDAFGVVALTQSINEVLYVPGQAGKVIDWAEESITTTAVGVYKDGAELRLVNPTPRGGPGDTGMDKPAGVHLLTVPHYQWDDFVLADSVQNVRAFGNQTALQTVQGRVQQKLDWAVRFKLDPTLEHQRIGAIKGIITAGDGSTLMSLYNEFGVTAPAAVDFDLDNATPEAGALRQKADEVEDAIAEELGGLTYDHIHSFVGKNFWRDLVKHPEVREVYLASQSQAMQLLNPGSSKTLQVGNIVFERYRGAVGGTPFIGDDDAHFFPVGSPGLWRTVYAPADFEETVNTPGLPRYARQWGMPNGKGRHLESQMNALNFITRPRALRKGTRT